MGFELVGQVWDPAGFRQYVKTLDLSWADGVTMHHTAVPNHSQRPRGFTVQHMKNLAHYYGVKLGWSAGPHLFIDDDQIWGLSSLERRGVHAVSFNSDHIGIEVLGNYDVASPTTGRGKDCWEMAAQAAAALVNRMGDFAMVAINAHRDDPYTDKTCPGKKVDMGAFHSRVAEINRGDDRDDDAPEPEPDEGDEGFPPNLEERVNSIQWQLDKIREML